MNDTMYLAHHGVKGMKWGVRKDRGSGMHRASSSEEPIRKFSTADGVAIAAKIGVTIVAAAVSGGVGGALVSTALNNEIVIGAATNAVNAAITAIGHQAVDTASTRQVVRRLGRSATAMGAKKVSDKAGRTVSSRKKEDR